MDLRKAVSRNLVPVLVITVAYEVGYPLLRQLAATAMAAMPHSFELEKLFMNVAPFA